MHPLREALHNELHARPSIHFGGPAHMHHYALLGEAEQTEALLEHIDALTGQERHPESVQEILEIDGMTLKWERHTEFLTLTLMVPRDLQGELWPSPPPLLRELIAPHQERVVSATLLLVEAAHRWAGSPEAYSLRYPAGSLVADGDATVWGDFHLTSEGVNRLLLVNRALDGFRLGRMARRLLDIETYRMMASLALPVAREMQTALDAYERELDALSGRNAAQQQESSRPLLAAISDLSARLEHASTRSRLRFSATEAYGRIVDARIEELREVKVGNNPRLGVFIRRRFQPLVRFCAAIHARQEALAESVARLNDLLRTRAQVEIEEQNAEMLRSLNERTSSQLKIQKAVEGLSIIVISYYLFSLFKLALQSLGALGVPVAPQTAAAVIGPLGLGILAVLAWRIWRVKQH